MRLFDRFRKRRGHPPGCRCVVTFVPTNAGDIWRIGQIVTVGDLVVDRAADRDGNRVFDTFQVTDRPSFNSKHPHLVYFVKYLRPIDSDMTSDDLDVANQLLRPKVVFS